MLITIAIWGLTFALWVKFAALNGCTLRGALIRPEYVGLLFLLCTYIAFPASWATGFGVPWVDYAGSFDLTIFSVATCLVSALGISIASAGAGRITNSAVENSLYDFPVVQRLAPMALAIGLSCSSIVLLFIVRPFFFTSLGTLLRRNGDGQGDGVGPLIAGMSVVLWASIYGGVTTRKGQILVALSTALYLFSIFLTGQKSRFVILGLLLFVRASKHVPRISMLRIALASVLALGVIGVTVAYQVQVRAGGFAIPVAGVDRSTPTGEVQYAFNRFSWSTFDSTRTAGAVFASGSGPPPVAISAGPVFGSLLAPVPSAIVPGEKPVASSRLFSQEYFADRWASGTGVPHAFGAEMLWYFGVAGSLLMSFFLFAALTRLSLSAHGELALANHGLRLLLLPFTIMLLKLGSDGALRYAFIVGVGLLGFVGCIHVPRWFLSRTGSQQTSNETVRIPASPRVFRQL